MTRIVKHFPLVNVSVAFHQFEMAYDRLPQIEADLAFV